MPKLPPSTSLQGQSRRLATVVATASRVRALAGVSSVAVATFEPRPVAALWRVQVPDGWAHAEIWIHPIV
jgi:hypothetical protein